METTATGTSGANTSTNSTASETSAVSAAAPVTTTVAPAAVAAATVAPDSAAASLSEKTPEEQAKLRMEALKKRATLMGIAFSNNIGEDALRAKIAEKQSADSAAAQAEAPVATAQPNPLSTAPVPEPEPEEEEEVQAPVRPLNKRQLMLADQMRLIRCHIVNLDPKKKDLPGEIISVANERLGNVRKFIPFGEATEGGYHIPYVIYKMLKKRKFLQIRTVRDPRTGANTVTQAWVKEFAIEVLDPLTEAELKQLAQAQIAAGSIDG